MIPEYLAEQDWPAARLPDVEVTHVWTQDRALSDHIARAARIRRVVDHPEHMLGEIDALLLARDDVENHCSIAAPFLRAGLPVYIDKPVALDLAAFDELLALQTYPGQIFSCSALRFAPEMRLSADEAARIGRPRLISGTTPKFWDTYAIHLIDPLLVLLGHERRPQRLFSAPFGHDGRILGLKFDDTGPEVILCALGSNCSGPLELRVHGERGWSALTFNDSFTAFRAALAEFLANVRSKFRKEGQDFNRRAVEILAMGRT
ncbi:Gfo/Idh/MocA family oxidoreductase [Algiphilus sp. NNCM1]|uniref:Gfo/Idh/MocA family oxidoreductase n=1 Tax=Algiphilus sp. TaxID=1872431 RepID=UPI0025C1CEDB|nr:Gfo/Idh/MocA family oxidoreductase [Algiphilus sp.]MBY8965033.1 Gfo/Idh/MocA family oxidoreductase [Algiphilus acroporae]MCI5104189.1 Gfo/Idh/MocA family oxidoreductase [Algiphilus sp.]